MDALNNNVTSTTSSFIRTASSPPTSSSQTTAAPAPTSAPAPEPIQSESELASAVTSAANLRQHDDSDRACGFRQGQEGPRAGPKQAR